MGNNKYDYTNREESPYEWLAKKVLSESIPQSISDDVDNLDRRVGTSKQTEYNGEDASTFEGEDNLSGAIKGMDIKKREEKEKDLRGGSAPTGDDYWTQEELKKLKKLTEDGYIPFKEGEGTGGAGQSFPQNTTADGPFTIGNDTTPITHGTSSNYMTYCSSSAGFVGNENWLVIDKGNTK